MKTGKKLIHIFLAVAVSLCLSCGNCLAEAENTGEKYVVWGRGKGITSETRSSEDDVFEVYDSGFFIEPQENDLRIQAYYQGNGGQEIFGDPVSETYVASTGAVFQEYTQGLIIASDYGTYGVALPLLNVYIASGGLESLGVPLEEQTRTNSGFRQTFERGTVSCNDEGSIAADTLAVRRNNLYYFKYSISGGEADKVVGYGKPDDTILVGDWNGDFQDTLCVRRDNHYYFKNSITGGEADFIIAYGRPGDQVYVGDWDGDGIDTLCVRRGNMYYFQNTFAGGEAEITIAYGRPEDQVYVGDWDGDGIDTLCVRRDNLYYIQNNFHGGEADIVLAYGRADDAVLAGDWDGDKLDTLCVRRDNLYYIKNSITGGEADTVLAYGKASDIVYVGNWQSANRGEKLELGEIADLSFNQSRDFQYSRLPIGFAGNAVNSAAFRKNALASWSDSQGNTFQYCAWYDYQGNIVLGKRMNDREWEYSWSGFQGDVTDAHNVISLAVDGRGYLHMAWSHHAGALNYAVSDQPGSLSLRKSGMIGREEDRVTYPEFYMQPSGNLFFLYRNGGSGDGNLVLNHYEASSHRWTRIHDNLISGEGERSPYWQACVDSAGRLHISWVWRETADVFSNYNMSYAVSCDDSGETFENSRGEACVLPLTESTAETICHIPQGSALINQTSMTVDENNLPYIISYWRVDGIVQYNILRDTGNQWIIYNTHIRTTDFELSGGGTQQLPCARPQILVQGAGEEAEILVLFRDEERGSKASMARLRTEGQEIITEEIIDLTGESLGEWEPVLDMTLWEKQGRIQIFFQKEHYQLDGIAGSVTSEYMYVADVTKFLNDSF